MSHMETARGDPVDVVNELSSRYQELNKLSLIGVGDYEKIEVVLKNVDGTSDATCTQLAYNWFGLRIEYHFNDFALFVITLTRVIVRLHFVMATYKQRNGIQMNRDIAKEKLIDSLMCGFVGTPVETLFPCDREDMKAGFLALIDLIYDKLY